jgi:hypothetical protein
MRTIVIALATASLLAGCATTSATFYKAPSRADLTALCRAYFRDDATETYRRDLFAEISRRGVAIEECRYRVDQQNLAIAATVAVAGVTALAVAACAYGSCPGGSAPASRRTIDYDCEGGTGDGPAYVRGPVDVRYGDPYRLDADGDGIGCEPYGDFGA